MNVMGVLLPYLIFGLVTLFFDRNAPGFFYQTFHALYVYVILGSLLPWIFIPLLSCFLAPPPGDDVTNFLINSGLPPLLPDSPHPVRSVLLAGLRERPHGNLHPDAATNQGSLLIHDS